MSKNENVIINGEFLPINEIARITGKYPSLYLDYFKIKNSLSPKIMEYIKDEANKRDTDTVIHEKSVAETLNSTNAELRIRIIEQKDTFMSGSSFWE